MGGSTLLRASHLSIYPIVFNPFMSLLAHLQHVPQLNSKFSKDVVLKIVHFHEILVKENKKQNLTRLVSSEDFINGHLRDVLELVSTDLVDNNPLDWGSGCGVPGLLSAILDEKPWVLIDSEKRKVEFLEQARIQLGLKSVSTQWVRAEEYLRRSDSSKTVVSRAVGNIKKFHHWLEGCSTWNSLILFKGPKWEEEWKEYSKLKNKLFSLEKVHQYMISGSKVERKIVKLVRI